MSRHRASLGIVFLIVFVDLVGFGIVIPILPLYADLYRPSPTVFGLFMASFSIMQFLASPILGRLSDRIGRRPVLLVSLLGSVIGYLIFGFAGSFGMLFLSRVIDGASGGNISTAHAVIADITGPADRARGMGVIGAAFGLGFILGPAIGGLLVGIRPWLPGVAAAAMSGLAFILVLTVLPETLNPSVRQQARRHPLDFDTLRHALAHPVVGACLLLVLIVTFGFATFETTFAQLSSARFGLGARQISFLFVYAGVLGAVVQGGLVGRLARRFGEGRLVVVGAALAAVGLGVLPWVEGIGAMLAALGVLALGQGLLSPSLSSLTSRLVDPDEVGGVMGVQQGLSSLGRIVGPFWGQWTYGSLGHAWPFGSGALAYVVAALVAVAMLGRLRRLGATHILNGGQPGRPDAVGVAIGPGADTPGA